MRGGDGVGDICLGGTGSDTAPAGDCEILVL